MPRSASRPPSSAAASRPPSSASTRPTSRISRPKTRQALRILPLYQSLVTQITGLSPENDEPNYNTAVQYVKQNIDHVIKGTAGVDLGQIDRSIAGSVPCPFLPIFPYSCPI